ncbi:hypothetical protein BU25DRAFT_462291 [Macroventuria anomochaeta]|uniref:Uncharacterized protein n=1 Tax=Macroventuria anomochaeta TaxID=301207 RepID=A0ACB6RMP3_9PLEO|nr:uncharacterized protein BU25DRAFT_462291 [Macroventuria anomochaeta]KAF2623146.1 hypothetical protein BU25DRAFT_462291 [Macroventuria anomochaeta]
MRAVVELEAAAAQHQAATGQASAQWLLSSWALFSSCGISPHALIPTQFGARCRVCRVLYNGTNMYLRVGGSFCDGEFCAGHRPADHRFSAFVSICCWLQNVFNQYCKHRPPVQPWKSLLGMTASELWCWEIVNAFQQKCKNGLVVLAGHWQALLQQGWCNSPIIKIWEIKVVLPAYYCFRHCAFAIHLVGNGWWIFDPTRVQFDPDWPLLSPLNDFPARTRSNIPWR